MDALDGIIDKIPAPISQCGLLRLSVLGRMEYPQDCQARVYALRRAARYPLENELLDGQFPSFFSITDSHRNPNRRKSIFKA